LKFWGVRFGSIAAAVLGALLLQGVAGHFGDFIVHLVVLAGLYVTLAVSLNLINGITGQFSIGHAAFYQVGAYSAGYLAMRFHPKFHGPETIWLVIVMAAGALGACIAGLIVGLPSLRLKGDYLAIVTLGFGEIIRIVVQNQDALGASYGFTVAPRIQIVSVVWLLAILCIAVCRNLLKSAHGLTFLAVREDEVASSAMGVNVTRTKVTAFIIGSAFAGAAGALYAHAQAFISPSLFTMDVSFIIVTMVVLGGTGSITGSAVAAVILFYLPEKMRDLSEIQNSKILGFSIGLILVIAFIRQMMAKYHGPKATKGWIITGGVVGGVVVSYILAAILHVIPALQGVTEGSKLRMVVFAVTLIVLMLLRPQGIFAHHEFSFAWMAKLFGKKDVPQVEVSA